MTRLSVLIPTYNRLAWLKEAYMSIDEPDVEIHILANGCKDGTPQWLESLHDPRLHLTVWPTPAGTAAYTWLQAQAPEGYTATLCDDDRLLPGGLALRRAFLDAHPNLELVFTRTHTMDKDGRDQGLHPMGGIADHDLETGAMDFGLTLQGNYVPGVTAMVRTEPFRELSKWQNAENFERFGTCGDWQMWLNACHQGLDGGYINEPTTSIRLHDKAISTNSVKTNDAFRQHMEVWKYWIKEQGYRPSVREYMSIRAFALKLAIICNKDFVKGIAELDRFCV